MITAFADKSFTFIIKTPPATTADQEGHQSWKRVLPTRWSTKVGKITREQLEEIAKTKMKDMNAADVDAARFVRWLVLPAPWA